MKASAKLRDGREPLLRAKIALNMFGLPIRSGVTMGSSDELGLHISTLFASGPNCRVTFLPNESRTPICVALKAGFGRWGSAVGSCIAISAELKLPAGIHAHHGPSIAVSFKPRNGDFMLLKSVRGMLSQGRKCEKKSLPSSNGTVDESPMMVSVAELAKAFDKEEEEACRKLTQGRKNGVSVEEEWVFPENGKTVGLNSTPAFLRGWSVGARSSLPLGQRACAGIRWRVEVPGDLIDSLARNPHKLLSRASLPVLTLDKISVQSCEPKNEELNDDAKSKRRDLAYSIAQQAWMEENEELNKVAAMCSSMRRQLHLVYSENRVLRNTMEEMRSNFNLRTNAEVLPSSSPLDGPFMPLLPDHEQQPRRSIVKEIDADKKRDHSNLVQNKQQQQKPRDSPPTSQEKSTSAPPSSAIAKELKKAIVASKSS